jgi:YHS domain-containing protein
MFTKDHNMNGYDMKGHDMKGNNNMSSDEKGYFTCPVMGTKMKIADAHSSYEYKGKTYYFCCGGCPDQFKANPEKYIKK